MSKFNKTRYLIIVLLASFFILVLFQKVIPSYAQSDGETLTVPSKFNLIEFSDYYNSNESISSINIPLPSAFWNITELELNFSDIKLGKEIKVIENESDSFKTIYSKGELGYGVQINITEPTSLFGVYIKGYREETSPPVDPVYVQIRGYDDSSNTPNNVILGSMDINITKFPDWYLHTFENEISLSVGQYYLVVNGSELTFPADKSVYVWFNNEGGPIHENLYTSKYDGSSWQVDAKGEPLLYKLVQRVDRSFNPQEINMTAQIDGDLYPVPGTGNLTISQNIVTNSKFYHIPIHINRPISLIFNLSYRVKAKNIMISDGYVSIKEDLANNWTINPNIERYQGNYSIKFNYPKNWYDPIVKRNSIDISSLVEIDDINKLIFIPNNSIFYGDQWEIQANSQNKALSLHVPETKFEPEQNLQFSVLPPIYPGNLTYILFNSLGFEEHEEIMGIEEITTEEIVLSYTLPSNPNEGTYKAYIFWNNNTAAGVETQEFEITVPFVLDPMIIVIIIAAIVVVALASFTTYKLVKRTKRIHEEYRQKIYNKYMDVLNLDYFIIIEKKTGLNIYEQVLASKTIDASLITGFLDAIRTFGIELTGANEQSQAIKLEYQDSKIIMSEYKNFRIMLIMKEHPSQAFLESIKALSYDIDNKYGETIAKFDGNISKFIGIKELLDQHLVTSLIYPLKVEPQDIKITSDEKSFINRALNIMKKRNTDYFFVSYLLSTKKGFQAKDAETILNLINKKIFQPKI